MMRYLLELPMVSWILRLIPGTHRQMRIMLAVDWQHRKHQLSKERVAYEKYLQAIEEWNSRSFWGKISRSQPKWIHFRPLRIPNALTLVVIFWICLGFILSASCGYVMTMLVMAVSFIGFLLLTRYKMRLCRQLGFLLVLPIAYLLLFSWAFLAFIMSIFSSISKMICQK